MPGIEDLTNIMTSGAREDVPMGPPPMGGPPVDMGTPMGTPPVGVDPTVALMGNENVLGGDVERGGGMSIEEDAIALADAVVGRAQGDIEAAVAILDEAKFVLLEGGPQQPMGGPPVDPMMAADGRYLSDRDLVNQLAISQDGRTLSDRDIPQSGRTLSDRDIPQSGRTLSARDLAEQLAISQDGRTLSDEDLALFLQIMQQDTEPTFPNPSRRVSTKRGKPGYNRRANGGSLTRKGDNNSVGKYAGGGSMDKDYFVDFRLKS